MVDKIVEENKGFDGIPDNVADLHSTRPTQVVLVSTRREMFSPKSSIDSGTFIKIEIQGGQNEFIDICETLLWLQLKIVNLDGSNIEEGKDEDLCCFVNGISSALFKNLGVRLNNQPISTEDGYYAYRADIENKFFVPVQLKSALSDAGHNEEIILFDKLTNAQAFEDPALDQTYRKRMARSSASKHVHFCSKLFSPIFDQPKPLPPMSKLVLNFERNSDAFCLLARKSRAQKIQIVDMGVEVKFDKVDAEVMNEMLDLTKKDPFKYQLRRAVITPFPKPPHLVDLSLTDVFSANQHLPRKILLAIVDQDAERGNRKKDPFGYQSFNMSSIKLVIGGVTRPRIELDTNLKRLNSLRVACESMLQGNTNGITLDNYIEKNHVVGWDLSPINSVPLTSFNLDSTESVGIEIKLTRAYEGPLTILVYAEYEAEMLLDSKGYVINHEFAL